MFSPLMNDCRTDDLCCSYVISRYYRRHEVTSRIAFFMLGAAGFAGGFGGLAASGLLRLGSVGSVTSWRVTFLIEG